MLRLSLPAPPASSVPPAGRAGGARLHFRQSAARKPPGSPFPPGLERERSPCHFRGAPPRPRTVHSPRSQPASCAGGGVRRARSRTPGELASERARACLPPATRLNGSRGSARPLSPSPAAGGAEPASAPAPSPAARGAAAGSRVTICSSVSGGCRVAEDLSCTGLQWRTAWNQAPPCWHSNPCSSVEASWMSPLCVLDYWAVVLKDGYVAS
ncbi:unnamed protein product [Eretmochelys imbricata]